jgi:protease IV
MGMASAVSGFFGLVWRILDQVRKTLHLLLLLVLFGFLLAALHTSIPIVPKSAALVIAPEGELVEQLSGDPLRRAFGEASGEPAPETLLKDVIDAIDAAKSDERIKIVVLDLGNMSDAGLAKMQEIATALRGLRAAGKRVVAIGDYYDQSQYYLAAQANEVYLDPLGLVYVDGFGYYRTFLKGALDALKVDVNVFRAGTYKSFTDQFTRSDMAAADREESSVWLNALWTAYQQDVTRARSLPATALADYIAEAPAALAAVNGDTAQLALQRGLVTALKSRRQVADELKSLVGEDDSSHSFQQVEMPKYLAALRSQRVLKSKHDAKLGIVVASGNILDGRQPPGSIGGESTADELREARFDEAVKAIVLRVDSPGGSMFASEQILREVQALRAAGKPVVVSMSSYAASGGYYISAGANQIYANPTTITGSIGVFAVFPTFQRSLEKLGVTIDGFGTTPLAGEFRVDRPIGPAGRQLLQSSIDHAYQVFLKRVGDGRKKTVEDVDKIAQGRVWAGADAERLGLVDHLGGLKDAIDGAAKLADLGTEYDVEYIEPNLSLREQLFMQLRSASARLAGSLGLVPARSALQKVLDPLLAEATRLAAFNDPHGLYAYCWCVAPPSGLTARPSLR